MTEREAIAYVLGTGLYGLNRKVGASVRLKIADAIIQGLSAAGYAINSKDRSDGEISNYSEK